jgi:hypothetical protein
MAVIKSHLTAIFRAVAKYNVTGTEFAVDKLWFVFGVVGTAVWSKCCRAGRGHGICNTANPLVSLTCRHARL